MSKLDDIIENIEDQGVYELEGVSKETQEQAKREIKDLMLELIGDMDDIQMLDAPNENAMFEQMERQELRYEILNEAKLKLRKKVNEL